MIRGNPKFVGDRLTQAREARGLTKRSLAEAINLTDTALANIEKSRSQPRDETIDKLASVLGFDRMFFLRPKPVDLSSAVFWRRQKSEPLRSQDRTRQRIEWAAELFLKTQSYVGYNELQLPALKLPNHWASLVDEDIEDIAMACREQWNLGLLPIADVTLAIENIGIPVLAFSIENTKQYGYCTWVDEISRPIIGVNTDRASLARQRFNLAHELGHILLHRNVLTSELRSDATHKLIEKQAHRFAAALLFPASAFFKEVEYLSLAEFAAHKERWGISILAQIVRAQNLGLCDEDRALALFKQASSKGYRRPLGEPLDDDLPLEKPRMLHRAIDVIEENSPSVLASLRQSLSLPTREEVYLTGRSLGPSNENIVQFRPRVVTDALEPMSPKDDDEWHIPF